MQEIIQILGLKGVYDLKLDGNIVAENIPANEFKKGFYIGFQEKSPQQIKSKAIWEVFKKATPP